MYFWALETSIVQTTNYAGVSSATVVQWYQNFQDICLSKLLRTLAVLSEVGKIMQIDESVMVKAKYHRGRQLWEKQWWVFGVYDLEQKVGHIELVQQWDAATLLPIIQKVVAPGLTYWSDEWAAYWQLSFLGYSHQRDNHSENFKDPQNSMCTNHVEAYWCAMKRRFKSKCETMNDMLLAYLDEHMVRMLYQDITAGNAQTGELVLAVTCILFYIQQYNTLHKCLLFFYANTTAYM